MSLITAPQVILELPAGDRAEATRALAQTLLDTGRVSDLDQFLLDVTKREEIMATGLPGGIGIPHARSAAVMQPSLAFGRSTNGVDWGAEDGPATLVFLIAAPEGGGEDHLADPRQARPPADAGGLHGMPCGRLRPTPAASSRSSTERS